MLRAGLEAFSAKGFHGASMRTIAAEADTTLSNLYNYFPSKAYLLSQVLTDTATDLQELLESRLAETGDAAAAQLDALVAGYVDFIVRSPKASIVAISEIRYVEGEQRSEVTAIRDSTETLFRDVVERGRVSGEFATPFAKEAARAVVSLCSSLSNWYRNDGPLGRDDIVERYSSFARGLVGAGSADPR